MCSNKTCRAEWLQQNERAERWIPEISSEDWAAGCSWAVDAGFGRLLPGSWFVSSGLFTHSSCQACVNNNNNILTFYYQRSFFITYRKRFMGQLLQVKLMHCSAD